MAAFGATGADFGNTRRSRELIARTRESDTGGGDEETSAPTPAANALLATLRAEILTQAAPPPAKAMPSVRPAASAKPRPAPADTPRMPDPQAHSSKRFLSKAERRREKKRKALHPAESDAAAASSESRGDAGEGSEVPAKAKKRKRKAHEVVRQE